jgi:hypothetical protein
LDFTCRLASCDSGYGDCDGVRSNGCEANLDLSLIDCGACGNVCSWINGQGICYGGGCMWQNCIEGFADCNGDMEGDGCEVDLANDPNHCWACGQVCPSINGDGVCIEGNCATSCNAGYDDCNRNAADGCEVDIESDPNNCGNCGDVCQGPSPVCVGGSCGIE